MNIILMLIGVVIVYNILRVAYRDNWSRNLSVDVTFSSNTATKGDTIKMVETVTNAKRMPLPCVNIKFSIDKNLVFGQEDNNSRITDKTYRNDVFSLLSNQRVTRKIDVLCARRGVYRLEAIETVFAGAFMNDIMINNKNVNHMITVYPKPENVNNLLQVNNSILGELERRKYLLEDKFVFAGIRDYQSYDSIRDVNWNASARTGKLMVNQYNETVSRNVCILLNLESEGVLMQEDVIEQAISIAAGLAQLLIGKGINVSVTSNGCDIDTKEQTVIEAGSGLSHFGRINTAFARIDLKLPMQEFSIILDNMQEYNNKNQRQDSVYVLISANKHGKLKLSAERLMSKHGLFRVLYQAMEACIWKSLIRMYKQCGNGE